MKQYWLLFWLILFPGGALAQSATNKLPDEPIGVIMKEWLDAVNSGEKAAIRRFVDSRLSQNAFRYQRSADAYTSLFIKLYEQSGGLDIVQVTPPVFPMPIAIIAKSRRGNRYVRITAGIDGVERDKLGGLGLDKAQPPGITRLAGDAKDLSEAQIVSTIKTFLQQREDSGDLTGVVLIAKDDRILLEQAYGFADREAQVPNTVNTAFQLASVGKMFTAVAIGQLVKAGKLSFDDTVLKVLPDYPNKEVGAKVTIKQLLTHSAGMGTFFESPGFDRKKDYPNATSEVEVYKDEKLFFDPGTAWRYSNAGFSLLGAIVERVSGKNFIDYVREKIFDPLAMKHTYVTPGSVANSVGAVFYTQSPDDPLGIEPFRGDRGFGARPKGFGGGYSTARDMFKFLRAYRRGTLLGPELTTEIATGRVKQNVTSARLYGYGIIETSVNGETVRGHAGGSRTDVEMLWNSGYTIIVMTNAIPPVVQTISDPIVELITRQSKSRMTTKQ